MNEKLLDSAVELHDYLYNRTVGQTVNYGAFHGFFKPFADVGVQINQTASKLVGSIKSKDNAKELSAVLEELEGQIMIAQSVDVLVGPDAERALELLDSVKGEFN